MTRPLSLQPVCFRLGVAALIAALPLGCAPSSSQAPSPSQAGLTAASLGSASRFAVLAGSTVTNTGSTTVEGDLGVYPGIAVTGFPPGLLLGGTIHSGDAVAQKAEADVTTAYNVLAGEACKFDKSGQDLGGLTLTRGVYCFTSSAQLTGRLTLDAEGSPDAVFIIQIGSTLTTASNSSVVMKNGGRECNVFWQVGSSATLGTTTAFAGSILALTSITLNTGARVSGNVLSRNGAVTLDTNVIQRANCEGVLDGGVTDGAIAVDAAQSVDLARMQEDAGQASDLRVIAEDAAPACDALVNPVDATVLPDLTVVVRDATPGIDSACCSHSLCDGRYVNLNSDSNHCGCCDTVCALGDSCSNGACVPGCCHDSLCNKVCVDYQSDPGHCGDCSTVCANGQSCSAGKCVDGCK